MLVKLNVEKQYYLNEPRLPAGLCDRKNKVLLAGRICSDIVREETVCTFSVRMEKEEETVEVMAETDLFDSSNLEDGKLLVIDGEFRTYYRKLRKYRPLIKVFAKHLFAVEGADEAFGTEWAAQKQFYPNRVYLEGVIEDNPVIVTALDGARSLKTVLLCGGIEIPCTVSEEAGDFTAIQKDDRYRFWGSVTTRTYQKRLGKGRFETDRMNEVLIQALDRVVSQKVCAEEIHDSLLKEELTAQT